MRAFLKGRTIEGQSLRTDQPDRPASLKSSDRDSAPGREEQTTARQWGGDSIVFARRRLVTCELAIMRIAATLCGLIICYAHSES